MKRKKYTFISRRTILTNEVKCILASDRGYKAINVGESKPMGGMKQLATISFSFLFLREIYKGYYGKPNNNLIY